jgi:hypothetical protein
MEGASLASKSVAKWPLATPGQEVPNLTPILVFAVTIPDSDDKHIGERPS